MKKTILAISPQAEFGKLLYHGLADSGQYNVCLEPDLRVAAARAASAEVDLVVLDAENSSPEDLAAWESLSLQRPNLPVLFFPPQNNLQVFGLPGMQRIIMWGKPFLMSDIAITVDSLLEVPGNEPSNSPLAGQTGNGWFLEEADAASWLKDLVAEYAVLAGYILQGNRLLATAGNLDAVENHEIAAMLARFWRSGRKSDLLRYFHLQTSAQDGMVYAAPLDEGQILGMVFSGNTSVNQARLLTHLAAQELYPLRSVDSQKSLVPPDFSKAGRMSVEESEVKIEDLNLSQILAAPTDDSHFVSLDPVDSGWQMAEQSVAEVEETDHFSWTIEPDQAERVDPEANLKKASEPYLYILHPENPDIRLKGPLADFLQNWILEYCRENGVQLDELVISRQIMACRVRVPDDCLSGSLARKLRQRSSQLIQEKFPEIFSCSPPEDFWAVDILIINSSEMPALPAIEDYILHTRSSYKNKS